MHKRYFVFLFFLVMIFLFASGCDKLNQSSTLEKQQREIYQLAVDVGYEGSFEEWLESIKGEQGEPGKDGKDVELIVIDQYIKWRNTGDSQWYNLISLDMLIGEDGREVELQVSTTHIQYRYQGDSEWVNLIALDSLIGPKGLDGKEVEFDVADGFIKWKYTTDDTWQDLVELSTLVGEKGTDGKEVTFQVSGNFIQWKYMGEEAWTNLVDLSLLVGPKGNDGASAYQLYLETVPVGEVPLTLEEWLSSLGNYANANVVIFKAFNQIVDVQIIDLNTSATTPIVPSFEGFRFIGWDNDLDNISENITINAIFEAISYTISFESNGGSILDALTGSYGTNFLLPIPTKEGYNFVGWYDSIDVNGSLYTNDNKFEKDLTLYAKWQLKSYVVTFIDYDDTVLSIQEVKHGFSASVEAPPKRTGYTFSSWDNSYTRVTSDLTVKALYNKNQYTLSFNENNGNVLNVNYYFNDSLTNFPTPTKVGHTFDGWFMDEELTTPVDFNTMPADDVTIYAKWIVNQYSITYYEFKKESFEKISTGSNFSIGLTKTNKVYAWGYNNFNQLGDGTTIKKSSPIDITSNFNLYPDEIIIDIEAGNAHSFAITSNNRIFAWGYNAYGQLGDGSTSNKALPVDITAQFNFGVNEKIISIEASNNYSFALTSDSRVLAWGYNNSGQLGDGSNVNKTAPLDITSIFELVDKEIITKLSAGSNHVLAFTTNNKVYAWGENYYGQLGDGTNQDANSPVNITEKFGLLKEEFIVQISAGHQYSFLTTSNKRIFSWGYNAYGQLGDGTTINKSIPTEITSNFTLLYKETIKIYPGEAYALALTSTNRVLAWGSNYYGQLGCDDVTESLTPLDITSKFNLSETDKILKLYSGEKFAFATALNGKTYGWGYNSLSQLGDGTTIHKYSPTDIFDNVLLSSSELIELDKKFLNYDDNINLIRPTKELFTFAGWYTDLDLTEEFNLSKMTNSNITLYPKWQLNEYTINFETNEGSFIEPITQVYKTILTKPTNPTKTGYTFKGWFTDVDLTNEFTYFSTMPQNNLTLYAKWEVNQYTIDYYGLQVEFEKVEAGENHTLALTKDNKVFAWGCNEFGQLGDGTRVDRITPVEITSYFILEPNEIIVDIVTGYNHSLAITSNSRVFSWGENSFGQLGDYTTSNKMTPNDVTNKFYLSENELIERVFAGGNQSFALSTSGNLYVWGSNFYGQLGVNQSSTYVPNPYNNIYFFNLNENEVITNVIAGSTSTFAVTSENRLFAWGDNGYYQLGDGTSVKKLKPMEITLDLNLHEDIALMDAGYNHVLLTTSNNRYFAWGNNYQGQYGNGTTIGKTIPLPIDNFIALELNETIIKLRAGDRFSIAFTSKGRVFTYGTNYKGELGIGKTNYNEAFPIEITNRFNLIPSEYIIDVAAGKSHSVAITSSGKVFTWGYNELGQLGNRTTSNQPTPVNITSRFDFSSHEFIVLDSKVFNYNDNILENNIEKPGYTFEGWYLDKDYTKPYDYTTMPEYNISLYGKWVE